MSNGFITGFYIKTGDVINELTHAGRVYRLAPCDGGGYGGGSLSIDGMRVGYVDSDGKVQEWAAPGDRAGCCRNRDKKTVRIEVCDPHEYGGNGCRWCGAVLSITADVLGYDGAYDGEGHGVTVAVTDPADGATVRYSVGDAPGEWSVDAPLFTNACEVTVRVEISAPNYATVTNSAKIKITKAANAWTADPSIAGWTYGEAAGVPDMGGAAFGTATVTYSAEPGDAGEYVATFTIPVTENYDGLTFEVPFTIARAAIECEVKGHEGAYDGKGHGVTVAVADPADGARVRSSVGAKPGSWSATAPLFTNACDATVWVEVSAANYATVTNSV